MGFLYETHMHTCLASACGISTGKEHVPEGRFVMPEWKPDERHRAYRLNEREEMVPMEYPC